MIIFQATEFWVGEFSPLSTFLIPFPSCLLVSEEKSDVIQIVDPL